MLTIYRSLVRNRIAARERGLSPVALSRLTWSAADQRAWDEAYRDALWITVERDGWRRGGFCADHVVSRLAARAVPSADSVWWRNQMDGTRDRFALCSGGFSTDGSFVHDGRYCRCGAYPSAASVMERDA